MEEWKDVYGFDGYQVSSLGRVRTYNKITISNLHGERHWKDRILKQKISKKDNCSRVELWKNGKHFTVLVHRLVAKAFLGIPTNEDMNVNHKDGNRQNNTVENLEWLSRADNIRHGFVNGFYHSQKPCVLVDKNSKEIAFRSLSEASNYLNRSNGYVSNCVKNGRFTVSNTNGLFYTVIF